MKRTIFFLLLTIFYGFFAAIGWTAPVISSVSGTVTHGSSITISGESFGSKTTAAPFLWDTVDNTTYSGISDGETIPVGVGYPWKQNNQNTMKMETTDAMRHSNSSKMYKSSGIIGDFTDTPLPNNPSTGTIYISWWWMPNSDPVAGSHSSKFLRLSDQSDSINKTFSWTQMHNYTYILGSYCNTEWEDWPGNVNGWNLHEVIMSTSKKMYYIYVNGGLLSSGDWSGCASASYNEIWGIGWDGGGADPPSLTAWMDDIYADNTLSRAVVGNASTYDSSTHREMQIPSAWSNGSISITVNQGSFKNGETAFIYVVDSNGNVNSQGYQVVFGGPHPPTGLRIVD